MPAPALRTARGRLGLGILLVAAVLGNLASVPLLFGVDFLFGSIAVLLVARLYGPVWAVAVALAAGVWTIFLWGHPYALLIFTVEAAFVGMMVRLRPRNLMLVDGVFWLFLGAPMAAVLYAGLLHLDANATLLIALKQSTNGILNAIAASLLLIHMPVERWITGARAPARVSVAESLAAAMLALVLLPAVAVMVLNGRWELRRLESELSRKAHIVAGDLATHTTAWIEQHRQGIMALAERARGRTAAPSPELARDLELVHRAFPDFHNLYVANGEARTVAFHPPVNERGESTVGLDFSDRPYFHELRRTLEPVISDVFSGRGGVFVPIVTISAPVLREGHFEGYALGALDLSHLAKLLASYEGTAGWHTHLLDRHGRVVASTDPERRPLEPFMRPANGTIELLDAHTSRWRPSESRGTELARWHDSRLVAESALTAVPWRLVVEAPIAPLQTALFQLYGMHLALMLTLVAMVAGLVQATARWMARPLERLVDATRRVPDALIDARALELPETRAREVATLVENFQTMAAALRRAFAELEARSEELARTNEELRAEMAERQRLEAAVQQRQKMAAIGTLAGGIAHDFNNILTALLGHAQLARAEAEPGSPVHEDLSEVLAAGERARELVEQILTFGRKAEGKRGPVALDVLCREVLRLLRATLPATARIEAHVAPALPAVLGDGTQIYQVLTNLFTNAEQALPDHAGTIELFVEPAEIGALAPPTEPPLPPGRYVRIAVRDDGAGMPPEVRDRIFEPFFTTKSPGEGTGMGMAVVHGIVVAHGGGIAVTSAPGAGTTVEVFLPAAERAAEAPEDADPDALPRGRGRILFVDDEASIARYAKRLLESLGYEVLATTHPSEALARFSEEPAAFDLVVTDTTMAEMSGDVLVQALRRIRPDVPIVLCTGYSERVRADDAARLGVDAFVMKPLAPRTLAEAVHDVLRRPRAG